MNNRITLSHGSGGRLSHDLIENLFVKYFNNPILNRQTDSAIINGNFKNLAFTTDSYVVDPVFFPGGNIGKLAICGTVNDLAVSGARPVYISVGFIIEEGLDMESLEKIVQSMAQEAEIANVKIVTGDTKVINKGKADKIFINTSGIGELDPSRKSLSFGKEILPGDKIILNGDLGRHEIAIMTARENLGLKSTIESDCASLNHLIESVLSAHEGVRFIRDITRGGIATILNELVGGKEFGIQIYENDIPVDDKIKSICELLGLDSLFMANEGRMLLVASPDEAHKIVNTLKDDPLGQNAAIVGEITSTNKCQVLMETEIGGKRIIDMLTGQQLPRIC